MLLFFLWRHHPCLGESIIGFLHWCSLLKKSSLVDSSFIWQNIEIEFNGLNLAIQNQVYRTQDISFLNSFENVLTNKIIWVLVLFWKNKIPYNSSLKNVQSWEKNAKLFVKNLKKKKKIIIALNSLNNPVNSCF